MTNEIRPALSAEEWAGRHAKRALRVFLDARGGITVAGDSGGAGTHDPATLHAIIAIANASLPDDDPRKLAWEDVDMLRQPYINMPNLAARIATLLRPREEG